MPKKQNKNQSRLRIKRKIRSTVFGTKEVPRLSVFRSNNHIYVQLIDDASGSTLVSATDIKEEKGTKAEKAKIVGELLAKDAIAKGYKKVVFDRNGFRYTGRIKILADVAREQGLIF